jgi:hypothetical protein
MDLIICVVLAILMFACFAVGYKEGLRLGMRSARGIEPKPIKTPIAMIKEAVKEHKEEKAAEEQAQIYDEFESYDGYTAQEKQWMKGGGKSG